MKIIKCAACEARLHRAPSKRYKKNFCDMNCRNNERVRWIGFIVANCSTMKSKEIAARIGIPKNSFRTWLVYINQMLKGYTRISFFVPGVPKKIRNERLKAVKVEKPLITPVAVKTEAHKPKKVVPPPKAPAPAKSPVIAKPKGRPSKNGDSLPNMLRLQGTRSIHVQEHYREVVHVERRDHRTFVIHHRQTA